MNYIAKSERLIIRDLVDSDKEKLFEIYSDKEAMKFRGSKPFVNITEVEVMLLETYEKIVAKTAFRYAVVEKKSNELIGTFLIKSIVNDNCEIGYSLGKQYWRNHYGFELLQTMMGYLKTEKYKKLNAMTRKDNIASYKLLEKAGFIKNDQSSNKEFLFEYSFYNKI